MFKRVKTLLTRNLCKDCDYYCETNKTCQSKKCCTGLSGYVTFLDRLWCDPYKGSGEWMTHEEALIDLQSIYKGHGGLYTDDSPAWELAFDALEKQIPKKPIKEEYRYGFTAKCINGHNIPNVCRDREMPYCPFCGQRLNWRDAE